MVVRGAEIRRYQTFVRCFTPPELRAWLRDAGFAGVDFLGSDGQPLTLESRRMIALATV